jgi:pimeloyl-ACP methyl ester carboxylesterase
MLSALGCHVVAHDYRGYGDSDGTPSEQGVLVNGLMGSANL